MSLKLVFNEERSHSLVSFANGSPSPGANFSASVLTHKSEPAKNMMVVASGSSALRYVGSNDDETTKYVTAEVDPSTGVARIFSTQAYTLRPLLPSAVAAKESGKVAIKRGFWQQQDDLNTDFGSHRKKKALNSRLKNNMVDATAVVEDTITKAVDADDSIVSQSDAALNLNQYSTVLPCNTQAEAVEDVYPLTSLFEEKLLKALEKEAAYLIDSTDEEVEEWLRDEVGFTSQFVMEHIQSLRSSDDDSSSKDRAVYLQLFIYLVMTYKLKYSDYRARDVKKFENFNGTVKFWLYSTFFLGQGAGRKMPSRMKDKILAYAIVIAWHLDGFDTKCVPLVDVFDTSLKTLGTHVKSLGGSIHHLTDNRGKRGTAHAQLTLPLNFPKVSLKKR